MVEAVGVDEDDRAASASISAATARANSDLPAPHPPSIPTRQGSPSCSDRAASATCWRTAVSGPSWVPVGLGVPRRGPLPGIGLVRYLGPQNTPREPKNGAMHQITTTGMIASTSHNGHRPPTFAITMPANTGTANSSAVTTTTTVKKNAAEIGSSLQQQQRCAEDASSDRHRCQDDADCGDDPTGNGTRAELRASSRSGQFGPALLLTQVQTLSARRTNERKFGVFLFEIGLRLTVRID